MTLIIFRRKVQPGITTEAVWLSEPTSDCSSLLVAALLPNQESISSVVLVSLAGGSLSYNATVSLWMPRNVRQAARPSSFSVVTGTEFLASGQSCLQRPSPSTAAIPWRTNEQKIVHILQLPVHAIDVQCPCQYLCQCRVGRAEPKRTGQVNKYG